MSAVTIPHMPELVTLHQLTPVALDLDLQTMTVSPETLEQAFHQHADVCAVVIVDLFGALHPLTELAPICRRHGALLIEDGAQAYDGRNWRGSPDADATLVSFGPIKSVSAVGGALVTVRDQDLLRGMAAEMASWSREAPADRAKRLLRWMGLRAMCNPELFGVFVRALAARGVDYDVWLRSNVRGFSGADLLGQIRRRPGAGLLRTLERRIELGASAEVRKRAQAGARVARQLAPQVLHLGHNGVRHTHWLFPIASRNPSRLVDVLRRAGFDATDGASTLVALPGAERAEEAMKRVVYIPAYDRMPTGELDELAAVINDVERRALTESLHAGTHVNPGLLCPDSHTDTAGRGAPESW